MSYKVSGFGRWLAPLGVIGVIGVFAVVDVGAEETAQLVVVVSGVEEIRGELVVAAFDNEADFDARSNPVASAFLPVDANSVTWTVDLPAPSDYAIAVYQDLNDNRELDTSRIGIPEEPYGFSNNARRAFGPPRFRQARVELGRDSARIGIVLRQ